MARYYTGGSFKYPVRITQKFWDQVTERREHIKDHNSSNIKWPIVDTTIGNDDIGECPTYPQFMVDYVEPILVAISLFIGMIEIAFCIYKFRHL